MAIGYRNGVSILLLVFYLPALAIAILLTIRHGLRRSSGWRFMIIFTLARILCACFALATISQPGNVSLYVAYTVLIGVAVSPLELVAFGYVHTLQYIALILRRWEVLPASGMFPSLPTPPSHHKPSSSSNANFANPNRPSSLLSRITTNINHSHRTLITTRHIQLFELLNTVGIILSIIGGVNSGRDYSKTGLYVPQTLSKVGLGLFIASFVAILAATVLLSSSVSHAEPGEKRILLAVAVSLPLLLVRLIYSSIYTFGGLRAFSSLNGSVSLLLCLALLEEMAIVMVYEGAGLTLRRIGKVGVGRGE